MLREYIQDFDFAIVLFDYEGCGKFNPAIELEQEVENRLSMNGWQDRSVCVIIEPELENWLWAESPIVANTLGWAANDELRSYLSQQGLWPYSANKPIRPKEALEAALSRKKVRFSQSIHQAIAAKASFKSCTSPSFLKFKDTIINWFQSPTA